MGDNSEAAHVFASQRARERLQQFVMRFCQENLELPAGVAEG